MGQTVSGRPPVLVRGRGRLSALGFCSCLHCTRETNKVGLGEQKLYGQYFTPRHIVDRIIQIIDPNPGEIIYDPAAGTAGFLVRAFEYIQAKINNRIPDPIRREQMVRELKEKHLWGVEKAPDVFKLGLMNMVLHGDGSTHLKEDDSLSSKAQIECKDLYDVIVANPPNISITHLSKGVEQLSLSRKVCCSMVKMLYNVSAASS